MRRRELSILSVMTNPRLLGPVFGGASWAPWRAFAAAVFGLPLEGEGLALFRACTGREVAPTLPAREVFAICGRRSGKSIAAALLAVHAAAFRTYRLSPGEVPVVLVCAVSRAQATVILDYCKGLLRACALTAGEVVGETSSTLTLASGVRIEVRSSNFRSVRGVTLACAIVDEAAFLRDEESTSPDVELHRALKPALVTTKGMLVAISSPWAARGLMYSRWKKHHGRDGDAVLTWVAASRVMNPTLDEAVIAEALADDPVAGRTEWLAAWREDVTPFLSEEQVEAVVVTGRHELLRREGVGYVGFVDASGGSQDSFTAAVAHAEGDRVVLDRVFERVPPFSAEEVVREVAELFAGYGLRRATSDRYAGIWVPEAFQARGLMVEQSAAPKAELYAALLPMILSKRVELLDVPRLSAQLVGLERKTARSGRESIAEPPGGRDDVANAVAGACVAAGARPAVADMGEAAFSSGRERDRAFEQRYGSAELGSGPFGGNL